MGNEQQLMARRTRCSPRTRRATLISALCATVVGCTSIEEMKPARPQLPIVGSIEEAPPADQGRSPETSAPSPSGAETQRQSGDTLLYFKGAKGALQRLSSEQGNWLDGRTLQLNFVNAPAADAARTIIADVLGKTVSVADGVNGVITLNAPAPVPVREALDALERTLAESNLVLIETREGFLLTSLGEAAKGSAPPVGARAIGYGATIVPVLHGAPSDIARLIEPFLSDRVTLNADDEEGSITVIGPRIDAEAAKEAIETFDAPYLTDRVFGLFKINFADAQTIKSEIESLLANWSGPASTRSLIALPRLNLLFVAARTEDSFAEIRDWINRMDKPSGGDRRRMRYYPVQYTPAEALAAQLRAAFGADEATGDSFAEAASISGGEAPASRSRPARSSPASFSAEGITITPDTLNNALIIRATDQEFGELLELIQKMDVPAAQVLIEATIAEVTLNDDLSFGVRWFFETGRSTISLSDNDAGAIGPVFPGLNYTFIDMDARVAIDTLASVTDVTVLSAPSIMVLNNQTAHLQVGDEVPVVTQQATSVVGGDSPIVSTVQLRETGVILQVSPRINASDVVVLDVTQEVSDVRPTTTSGIDSPTIQQRRFTSTVAVRDRGTVALGGLIRETYSDNASGVPFLMKIPLIGKAFKSREVTKRRTELIVFLTPHIIRSESDVRSAFRQLRRDMRLLYERGDGAEERELTQ